ncbi:hypothetical protein [Sciscionella marina]|uniref:hypothetical protein n=1 Tax=Sciscionella marina TaxID=508770 RepID=UPI0003694A84|nr:hypothetical protein [Sciscionella marina]
MTTDHATETTRFDQPGARRAFGTVRFFLAAYAAFSAAVLLTVLVLALAGHPVTAFVWGRSGGVLASAAVTYWLAGRAARGARWAYRRVRILTVVVPIAILAIDLIPGALPPWFIGLQAVCALAVAAAAFPANGATLRAAFGRGTYRTEAGSAR